MRTLFLTLLVLGGVATAQTYTPEGGTVDTRPGLSFGWELLGSGYMTPYFLTITSDGTVFTNQYNSVRGRTERYDEIHNEWIDIETRPIPNPYGSAPRGFFSLGRGDTLFLSRSRRSVDGGTTWHHFPTGDLFYETDEGALVISAHTRDPDAFSFRSDDRGDSWTPGFLLLPDPDGTPPLAANWFVELSASHPSAPTRIVGSHNNGFVYSDDGGLTWTRSDYWDPYQAICQSLVVTKQGRVLGIAYDNRRPGMSLFASDDGAAWTHLGVFRSAGLITLIGDVQNRAVDGPTEHGRVYAVSRRRSVWHSDDGGDTWLLSPEPLPDRFPNPDYPDSAWDPVVSPDGRLYAAVRGTSGPDAMQSGGIYRSVRSPAVNAESDAGSDNGLRVTVAPNPTGGATAHVRVALPDPSMLRVELFDVLGRRMGVLHDGLAAAGMQTVEADVSALPAGVYSIIATAGDTRRAARFTIAR